jgi:hypothetical protein
MPPKRVQPSVVHLDVDALCTIRTLQYQWLSKFAQNAKMNALGKDEVLSHWWLHGSKISTADALDFVRIAPDLLSTLSPHRPAETATATQAALSSWVSSLRNSLPFLSDNPTPRYVPEKLSYVISVSEAVEIATQLKSAASSLLTTAPPVQGQPQFYEMAWQAHSGIHALQHRLESHCLYTLVRMEQHAEPSRIAGHPITRGHITASLYLQPIDQIPSSLQGLLITPSKLDPEDKRQWHDVVDAIAVGSGTGQFLAEHCAQADDLIRPDSSDHAARVLDLMMRTTRPLLEAANKYCDHL